MGATTRHRGGRPTNPRSNHGPQRCGPLSCVRTPAHHPVATPATPVAQRRCMDLIITLLVALLAAVFALLLLSIPLALAGVAGRIVAHLHAPTAAERESEREIERLLAIEPAGSAE